MGPFCVGPIRAEDFLEYFLAVSPSPEAPRFTVGMFTGVIEVLSSQSEI
jgi:hypothetical protein